MAAARVDLNGALIRPVHDPYYNQQGWGSPQAQPWWTEYNLGNTTPMATSNTPQISGGSLIGNALQQGWNAMVSPRKGLSEATTEVKPPVRKATAATQPPAPPVVIQSATTTVPIAPQQTAMPTITGVPQPSLVPGTVPTMQPTTTVPTVGMPNTGLPMVGATPNGLGTLATNPATAPMPTFLEVIMAQLAELQASNKALIEKLDMLSANKATTGATLSCGCPAPAGKGSGDCKCTPKMDASKKTEEKKPVKETEKIASSS